jgi:hypothetical protein
MREKYRRWIPGVVFWVLFVGSLAFSRRYPWLDTMWYAAWMLFLIIVAVCATLQILRNRHETGGLVGYRGVPRWAVTLFGGEVDSPNKTRPKTTND